jgi:uncharacterized glyoxalase superfamily protein PhnB
MPPDPAFPIMESDKELVLHARLNTNDTKLMYTNSPESNARGSNMYISITTPDSALANNRRTPQAEQTPAVACRGSAPSTPA